MISYILSRKHRIYPNKYHREVLNNQFGCNRFVWNYFVDLFNRENTDFTWYEMNRKLVKEVKRTHLFLQEAVAQSLYQSLFDLSGAIKASKRRRNPLGKPKFKKKHWKQSCRFPERTRVDREKGLLYLPKMMKNPIKIVLERDLPEYSMVTIIKESDDKWFACFKVKEKENDCKYNSDLKHLGLDLGLKDLVVTSEGERIAPPQFFRKAEENIARKNKALSKKIKKSKRWLKCRRKLSKTQNKVRRQRLDFIHKLTSKLADDPNSEGISVETLRIKNMTRNHKLTKSITDASWYLLLKTLKYKLEMRGKVLTPISSMHPSTQLCSTCDNQTGPKNLSKLETRTWTCSMCGHNHDRDINAAINIAKEADRVYHYQGSSGYLGQATAA